MNEQMPKDNEHARIFMDYLRQARKRVTPERFMVLDSVYLCPRHFTADEVAARMDDSKCHIALATIYGTLQLMVEAGILTTLALPCQPLRYELAATTHMHLVCTCCGHVKDLRDRALMRAVSQKRYAAFTAERCDVTVYGICSTCRRQNKKNQITSTNNKLSTPTI